MANDALTGSVPDSWEVTSLGEVVQRAGGHIQTGPFGSQLHASDYVEVGIPSIMPVNIGEGRIISDGIARITEADARRLSRHRVSVGDIVYSRRGDVERHALIQNGQAGWLCGTGCIKVDLGQGVVLPRYASYYLRHPATRAWISRHAVGATMPNLNMSIMSEVPFVLPPPATQQRIADVLGKLDDKIELNRRMNRTLEKMAAAIFKSWFIDFDPTRAKAEGRHPNLPAEIADLFPDTFEDSDLGPIPKGWTTGELGDVIEILDSKRIPLSSAERAKRKGPYPYYGAAGILDHVDDFLFSGTHILMGEDGSVVTDDDKPVVQYVWDLFWVNNHAHVLRGKNGFTEEQLYLFLKQLNIRPFVTGAVQPKINQRNMKSVPMVVPPKAVSEAFGRMIGSLFQKFRANANQSRTLSRLRDTLLPKLLSGEIELPEAEAIAEEVKA